MLTFACTGLDGSRFVTYVNVLVGDERVPVSHFPEFYQLETHALTGKQEARARHNSVTLLDFYYPTPGSRFTSY